MRQYINIKQKNRLRQGAMSACLPKPESIHSSRYSFFSLSICKLNFNRLELNSYRVKEICTGKLFPNLLAKLGIIGFGSKMIQYIKCCSTWMLLSLDFLVELIITKSNALELTISVNELFRIRSNKRSEEISSEKI